MDYTAAMDLAAQPSSMDAAQAKDFLNLLMSGELAPKKGCRTQTLSARGETPSELAAFVGLLELANTVPFDDACADCCGTGGSGRSRFNVSTTAAIVVASCGIPVAKHGNKGSKRPNGSFDLLEELGVPLGFEVSKQAELLESHKLTFCFARAHHPAVGKVCLSQGRWSHYF